MKNKPPVNDNAVILCLTELPADPEIAAILEFEPTPRKRKVVNGWTPAAQRLFIARLAETGSPAKAAEALGRCRYGAEKLCRGPEGEGFRAAWVRALEIAEERAAAAQAAERAAWAGERPPGGTDRRKAPSPQPSPAGGEGEWELFDPSTGSGQAQAQDETDMAETEKLELIERLAVKFLKKVAAEREARLAGEIVAADFYLRQVTALEVIFDLLASPEAGGMGGSAGGGMAAWEMLKAVQRGGHNWAQIADTPFARLLDDKRREYWRSADEPERPEAPADDDLIDHGDHRTAADHKAYGAGTAPARGYSAAAWAAMDAEAQRAARRAQFDKDAQAQVEWEAKGRRDFENRRDKAR